MISQTKYPISMEIEGRTAMFANPAAGSDGCSYPAPTKSAVKGIFEQVFFCPFVRVVPTRVEICKPVKTMFASFSSHSSSRKHELVKKDNACIIRETVLFDVCYKMYGYVQNLDPKNVVGHASEKAMAFERQYTNHAHSYACQFERRLRRGQCFRIPVLGRSECICDWFGPLRDSTKPYPVHVAIPSMLIECFSEEVHGSRVEPKFADVQITEGVLEYV